MASRWWKFSVSGAGTHLLCARNLGTLSQEVLLDGTPLAAPLGTTQFTGPGASLLELREAGGEWALLLDGTPVEAYQPELTTAVCPVVWWKFCLPSVGTHHLRVKNMGMPGQEICLDGSPIDAPEGTMAFTGPGGVLVQLHKRQGTWGLTVDGHEIPQCGPQGDNQSPSYVWNFTLPSTGSQHQVSVSNVGTSAQQLAVDGAVIPAPPGQASFTGPAGSLLELRNSQGLWELLVDGVCVEASNGGAAGQDASWTFFGPTTGLAHELKAFNVGVKGQKVFIDGNRVEGPEGQLAFTGPGGVLLELKSQDSNLGLLVDSLTLEEHNAKVAGSGVTAATGARAPVSSGMALPQGVSHDPATGKYNASMRIQGRFKSLGDFATPEEAHQRYLEEKKKLSSEG